MTSEAQTPGRVVTVTGSPPPFAGKIFNRGYVFASWVVGGRARVCQAENSGGVLEWGLCRESRGNRAVRNTGCIVTQVCREFTHLFGIIPPFIARSTARPHRFIKEASFKVFVSVHRADDHPIIALKHPCELPRHGFDVGARLAIFAGNCEDHVVLPGHAYLIERLCHHAG